MSNDSRIKSCCVMKCPNTSVNSKVRFFEFPELRFRSYQRNRWVQVIKQQNGRWWTLNPLSVICGDHFVTGQPSTDTMAADYMPSVFATKSSVTKVNPIKCRSVSVKQFALEYIKYDALLEPPCKANINNEHRKCAYVLLARALHITVAMARAWEQRFRDYFQKKMAATSRGKSRLRCRPSMPTWVNKVEARLNQSRREASPGGVVRALCAAARARGALCATSLYNDVRRALRLSTGPGDLHAVWVAAQRVSLAQVTLAGRAGDASGAAAPADAARVADLVLLHTDVDAHQLVTDESLLLYEESFALHMLWQLVQRHRLEEATPENQRVRAQRWTRAYRDYLDSGRQVSLIVLQRRWHELKLQARLRLAAHWRRPPAPSPDPAPGPDHALDPDHAPDPDPAPHVQHPRPAPLHLAILKRFPHVATQPLQSWRQLVLAGAVVIEPLENKTIDEEDPLPNTPELSDAPALKQTSGVPEVPLAEHAAKQSTVEPTTAEEPNLEHTTAEEPHVEHSTTEEPNVKHYTAETPNVEHTIAEAPNVENTTAEALNVEHTISVAPNVEHTTAEAPNVENTTAEALNVEHTISVAPNVEHTTAEAPNVKDTTAEAPYVEHTISVAPNVEHTTAEAPNVEDTTAEAPYVEHTISVAPYVEHTISEAPNVEHTISEAPNVEHTTADVPNVEDTIPEAPNVELTTAEQPDAENSTAEEPNTEPTTAEKPNVEHSTVDNQPVLLEVTVDQMTSGDPPAGHTSAAPGDQERRAEDKSHDIAPAKRIRYSDTDSDAEDKLVIDERRGTLPCDTSLKQEPREHTELAQQSADSVSTLPAGGSQYIKPAIEVLHMIDPSAVKTEIIFESDEDEFKPYGEDGSFELELKLKDPSFICNRIVFDDELPSVSCDVTDVVHVKTETDVTNVSDVAGVGDVTDGDDFIDEMEWKSDQKMDELVSDEPRIDPKLLMDTSINLIRIDQTRAWRQHSRLDRSIRVSRLSRHLYAPAGTMHIPDHTDTYEIEVDRTSLDRVANTHAIKQFCRNIKRELIEEQMSILGETPSKVARIESDSDEDKPLLVIKENKSPTETHGESIRDRLRKTTPRNMLERNVTEESSSEEEFFNEQLIVNMRREEKRIRARSRAATSIEWSACFGPVFGKRVAKRVELPDIEQVRRDNSNILTAQVAPISATAAGGAATAAAGAGDAAPAWSALSLPAAEQLPGVLEQMSAVSAAEHVLEAAHCCAARRHRVVNDTRRRLGLSAVPLHTHADGACACCCAHLCDEDARRRLELQLHALHDDIARMLRASTEAAKGNAKTRRSVSSRKHSRSPSPSVRPPAAPTATPTHTNKPATKDMPPPKSDTEAKGSTTKPATSANRSNQARRSKPRQPLSTAPAAPAARADDYEEWQRQKTMNAQYFHIKTGNISSKKDISTTAQTTNWKSTTTRSATLPINIAPAPTPNTSQTKHVVPLKVLLPPAVSSQPPLPTTRTAVVPTAATDVLAGDKRVIAVRQLPIVGNINTALLTPVTLVLPGTMLPLEQAQASTDTAAGTQTDIPKLIIEPIKSYRGNKPPRTTKRVPEASQSVPLVVPETHHNRGAKGVAEAKKKSLSILEEYSRTLSSESGGSAAPGPSRTVNALSLRLPGPEGPQTTIIMALTVPSEEVINNTINTLYANDTIDLTTDQTSQTSHTAPGDTIHRTARLIDISEVVKNLKEPTKKPAKAKAPKLMSLLKRNNHGEVIEIDDSDSNHSGDRGDRPPSASGEQQAGGPTEGSNQPRSVDNKNGGNQSSSSNISSNQPSSSKKGAKGASKPKLVSILPSNPSAAALGTNKCPSRYANTAAMTDDFMNKLREAAAHADDEVYVHKKHAPLLPAGRLPCGSTLLCMEGASLPFVLPRSREQHQRQERRDYLIVTDSEVPVELPTYWTLSAYAFVARVVPGDPGPHTAGDAAAADGARDSSPGQGGTAPAPVPEKLICQKNHNFKVLTALSSAEAVLRAVRARARLFLLSVHCARVVPLDVHRTVAAGLVRYHAHADILSHDILYELEFILIKTEHEAAQTSARPAHRWHSAAS